MSAFEDLLRYHGVRYVTEGHQHSRNGWVQFDCPYCGPGSEKFHMGYRISGAYVNCWRCGRHDLLEVVSLLTNQPTGALIDDIRGLRSQTSLGPRRIKTTLRNHALTVPTQVGALLAPHQRYLRRRRYAPRLLKRLWGLGGVGASGGILRWRIFIPIYQEGRLVSWTARAIGKAEPRYVTCPANQELVDHSDILFGEDYCRDTAIIVEGPFDVMRIGPGAVASLGTGVSMQQINRLVTYPRRVVCFDNEPLAQKKAAKLANQLSAFPGETHLVVLDAADPGEASRQEIHQLRKEFLDETAK